MRHRQPRARPAGNRAERASGQSIMAAILRALPAESGVRKIEYEGPKIALYTDSPRHLLEHNEIVSGLVNTIKKRIVLRTLEESRKDEAAARRELAALIPKEAGLQSAFFDAATGEVTLEAKRPWLLQRGASSFSAAAAAEATGWIPRVKRAPTFQSSTMQAINHSLKASAADRARQLKRIGEDIFRPRISQRTDVSLFSLGGFGQVGRSCMLLATPESRVLVDCGVNPGGRSPAETFPRLDWLGTTLEDLDAVVIGHAHLDHTGFLPVLCKYGYRGPIYCTEPTLPMMNLIQLDAIKVAAAQGRTPVYSEADVRQIMKQAITLPYGTVTDISPDVKLVLANAGHIVGSALCHFHIGNGDHNFVYSGDLKFAKSALFEAATWNFPRAETLLIESTYGAKEDIQPSRQEVEALFVKLVNETLAGGGKVVIPIPAVGRAATSGMLEGGPILEYFRELAPDERNLLLFVSYQVNGTMGRRVLDGSRQAQLVGRGGKVGVVNVRCRMEKLDGFSGHSDYNQLMSFVQRLRPKLRRVLVNHGERRKSENLASAIRRLYRIPAHNPQVQEAVRLF